MGPAAFPALLLGFLLCSPAGASGPCWENPKCPQRGSDGGEMACSGSCRARLSLESPVFPGNAGEFPPPSASLRRYVMSHFRWNHFGPKNATSEPGKRQHEEEEEEEDDGKFGNGEAGILGFSRKGGKRSYSMEHFRWGKPVGRKRRPVKVYPNGVNEEEEENSQIAEFRREDPWEEEEEDEEEDGEGFPEFPWNSGKEKRYGGFMGAERARTPLVTLFRNAIGKSFAKGGQ